MKISVALCTYNGEKFLREQLDSILAQTLPVDEIVVCDDGSQDGTKEILEEYAGRDKRFILAFNSKNLGYIKNFEQAIRLTTGGWIFLSDQDDVWFENKVSAYVKIIQAFPSVGVVFGNATLIDERGHLVGVDLHHQIIGEKIGSGSQLINSAKAHRLLAPGNFVTGATLALSRKTFKNVVPFEPKIIHDYWIVLAGSLLGDDLYYVVEPLTKYRIHSGQSVSISWEARPAGKTQVVTEEPARLVDRRMIERFSDKTDSEIVHKVALHKIAVAIHRARRLQRFIRRNRLGLRWCLALSYWRTGRYTLIHQKKYSLDPLVVGALLWDLIHISRKESS